MKKLIATATVSLALLVGLAGCGSSTTSATTDTTTTVQDVPAPVYVSPEDTFLNHLHSLGDSTIDSAYDSTLLSIGNNTCKALDSGSTVTDLVLYLVRSGSVDGIEESAGKIVGAAVLDLCPEYTSQLQDFTRQYGS